MSKFVIATINTCRMDNVAGVRQLLDKTIDIYLIQETILPEHALQLRFPGYKIWLSKGEGTLGIATITKDTLELTNVENIIPGRLQVLSVRDLRILNVYSPAGTNMNNERRDFFSRHVLSELRLNNMIMAGDFNCVTEQQDVEENFRNKRSLELRDLIQTFSLTDVFREGNPNAREYTFHRPGSSSARLDRVYVSRELYQSIQSCKHIPVLSDHKAVVIEMTFNSGATIKPRTQHTWKLNNSILAYEELLQGLRTVVNRRMETLENEDDLPRLWEEMIIPEVTAMLKEYSIIRSEFRKTTKQMLQHMLEQAIEIHDWETAAHARQRLRAITDHELYGYVVRSRESELDEALVGNIHHARKEFKKCQQNELTTLKINGQPNSNIQEIEEEVEQYYNALYKGYHRTTPDSDEVTNTGTEFTPDWTNVEEFLGDLPQLSEQTADALENPITENEVAKAIKESKNGSSPGPDGLTYEFYKATADWIVPILTRLFNTYVEQERLPERYTTARTRLIPKVDGIPGIEDLRPITLQNNEYKLFSKTIATRLLKAMDEVISPSQHCAIPGRNISTPLLDLVSVVDYASHRNIDGYILSTDIFKAYDRTNLDFIMETMRRMGFKPSTINLIKTMHRDCHTIIMVGNGIQIAVLCLRQGDPVSGPLFTISIDPLNRKLNERITGIQIGNTRKKSGAFMDDIHAISSNLGDLPRIDETFRQYEDLNGTLLSRTRKTRVMGIGRWQNRTDWPIPWLQTTDRMKILGVTFSADTSVTIMTTWNEILNKMRAGVQRWISDRNWTMLGKIKILHTFILSQAWYVAQVLPCPQRIISEMERSASHYLFNDQVERIQLEQLYKKKEEGGLGLVNISAKCQALLGRTANKNLQSGSQLMQYWLAIPLRIQMNGPRAETTTPYFREVAGLVKEVLELGGNLTSKGVYQHFTETPPPSRIEERQRNPELTCPRMYLSGDPKLADMYFKVAAETLPTKARLHHLNPRRWENPNCVWCNVPASIVHTFIECQGTSELWEWLRGIIVTLEPDSFTWPNDQLLELRYPETPNTRAIAYLTMITVQKTWEFIRQHRQLSVQRLSALVKDDLKSRQQMKLPVINNIPL